MLPTCKKVAKNPETVLPQWWRHLISLLTTHCSIVFARWHHPDESAHPMKKIVPVLLTMKFMSHQQLIDALITLNVYNGMRLM